MSKILDLDIAVNFLKEVVQQIRCSICDKNNGTRMRYWCGHTACGDCVESVSSCLLCLTPPRCKTTAPGPVLDTVLTARVKHISELLTTFEDTFNIDVNRRQRISEQLKIEKDIFPQYIQAPQTYSNKHKIADDTLYSNKSSKKRKQNIIPGELVDSSLSNKMDNSKDYVQNWLDQHETEMFQYQPRKPFSDLGVNSPTYQQSPIKKRADIILEKARQDENKVLIKSRKRSRVKTTSTSVKSDTNLGNFLKTVEKGYTSGWKSVKRAKNEFDKYNKQKDYSFTKQKNEKEESGIVMDDQTIVIEDSLTQVLENADNSHCEVIDKDRQAWLAVLAADNINASGTHTSSVPIKYDQHVLQNSTEKHTIGKQSNAGKHSPSILGVPGETSNKITPATKQKVPFLKKSNIIEPCLSCNANKLSAKPIQTQTKDVSVTVETAGLVTTITVSRVEPRSYNKTSKSIQTEENVMDKPNHPTEDFKGSDPKYPKKSGLIVAGNDDSQDLFSDLKQTAVEPKNLQVMNNLVTICESGSDSENEPPVSLTVTADVHKSMDAVERRILSEIHHKEIRKPTCVKRGYSPESSNSSDKENRDPNRLRKSRINKNKNKKKGYQIKNTSSSYFS